MLYSSLFLAAARIDLEPEGASPVVSSTIAGAWPLYVPFFQSQSGSGPTSLLPVLRYTPRRCSLTVNGRSPVVSPPALPVSLACRFCSSNGTEHMMPVKPTRPSTSGRLRGGGGLGPVYFFVETWREASDPCVQAQEQARTRRSNKHTHEREFLATSCERADERAVPSRQLFVLEPAWRNRLHSMEVLQSTCLLVYAAHAMARTLKSASSSARHLAA